jgi:HD-GYP domain-containing protein (c-di-GMP phosphodiesterase class II)
MRSDRPYRKALAEEDAEREIQRGAGTQFDPEVVQIFTRCWKSGDLVAG